jgi:uncharacterized protein
VQTPLRDRRRRASLLALVYFDSSALVKLLAEEEGSDLAAQLWDGRDAAVASRLAYPEVRAALAAAVHLASALAIGDSGLIVAVWDRRLHAGARAAGCRVAPSRLG